MSLAREGMGRVQGLLCASNAIPGTAEDLTEEQPLYSPYILAAEGNAVDSRDEYTWFETFVHTVRPCCHAADHVPVAGRCKRIKLTLGGDQ